MHKHFPFAGFIFLILFTGLVACNKELNIINNWAPQILGPLVNGYANVADVADLHDKYFQQSISTANLGSNFPPFYTGDVPPLFISEVGPFPYVLSDFFQQAFIDSAEFIITVQNAFPITISAGTHIVFRASADTTQSNNIVLDYVLPADISAFQTSVFDTIIHNTYVTDTLFMYLQDFQSPGATNASFSPTPSILSFEIKFLNIFNAELKVNKSLTVLDTTTVTFAQSVSNLNDSAATGLIKIFITNGMPINFNYQMYFYDGSMNFIDSMYHSGDMNITHATTNFQGALIDSVGPQEFDIPLSAARIGLLKKSQYLVYSLVSNTNQYPPPFDFVGSGCYIHILITGNIKLEVAKIL